MGCALQPLHAGVEGREFFPVNRAGEHIHAVVGHEDNKGVIRHAMAFEVGEEEADIVVDVFDHAITRGRLVIEPEIEKPLFVFLRRNHRTVGGIQREVGEERLFLGVLLVNPSHGGGKEQVCAEAFRANDRLIVQQHAVEVSALGVLFEVTPLELPDAARAVHEHLVEPPVLRQIRLVVAKMPLSEQARGVTSTQQGIGNRHNPRREALTLEDGVGDAHLEFMPPAHDRRAGGRAGRTDMEVGEPRALCVETIDVRRFQIWVPRAGEVTQALVVGENEDDVRATTRKRLGFRRETNSCDGKEEDQGQFHWINDGVGVMLGGFFDWRASRWSGAPGVGKSAKSPSTYPASMRAFISFI